VKVSNRLSIDRFARQSGTGTNDADRTVQRPGRKQLNPSHTATLSNKRLLKSRRSQKSVALAWQLSSRVAILVARQKFKVVKMAAQPLGSPKMSLGELQ
jgi:hypothetical protein